MAVEKEAKNPVAGEPVKDDDKKDKAVKGKEPPKEAELVRP